MTRQQVMLESRSALEALQPFSDLSSHLLADLAQHASIATSPAGKVLAKQAEELKYLVCVLEGELHACWQLPDGKSVIKAVFVKGQVLGWLSVIDSRPIQYNIVASSPVRLLLLPIEITKQVIFKVPSAAEFVMRQMAETIRRLEAQSRMLGVPNAYQRVYVHLLHLVESSGDLRLPKQNEIASIVNTSRETVSRAVQLLIKHGVILKNGRTISVQKIELFRKAAESGAEALEHNS